MPNLLWPNLWAPFGDLYKAKVVDECRIIYSLFALAEILALEFFLSNLSATNFLKTLLTLTSKNFLKILNYTV